MNVGYWFAEPEEAEQALEEGIRSTMGVIVVSPNIDEAIKDGLTYEYTALEVDLDALPPGAVMTYTQLCNQGVMLDIRGGGEKLFCTHPIPASALSVWNAHIGSQPKA